MFKLKKIAAPWEILLEYLFNGVYNDSAETVIKEIILTQRDLQETDYPILSQVFETSVEFWKNLQIQWEKHPLHPHPLVDNAKEVIIPLPALNQTLKTGLPTRTYLNEDKTKPVYVITEQTYKYLVTKCEADEAWDLGWLGQSEEHSVLGDINPKLKRLIEESKL